VSRVGRSWRRWWAKRNAAKTQIANAVAPPATTVESLEAFPAEPLSVPSPATATSSATVADRSPEGVLTSALSLSDEHDTKSAVRAFDALVSARREAHAVALGRALLHRSDGGSALRLRVAEAQVAMADDDGAVETLAPVVDRADAPLAALAQMARALDRLGREAQASLCWQRVLARDVDYPGAKRRLERSVSAPASAGATLAAGGELSGGRYLVRRELGRGGAGAVFEALDRELGRPVALKVYHDRGAAARKRLRLEARVPARLEHPGVIRIFDLDLDLAAIAMEWVRGPSLKSALSERVVEPLHARSWLLSLVDALTFVHGAGLVHRDLKPSNVLIRRDRRAVLTDFGLALPLGEVPTRAGEGTRGFAAPEQLRAAPADFAADVFAFGVMLKHARPALAVPGPALEALSQACTAHEASARPSLAQVARDLDKALRGD